MKGMYLTQRCNYTCLLLCSLVSFTSHSETTFSGGFWFNYNINQQTHDSHFGDEALVIYLDKQHEEQTPWNYSAEFRIGPGGFSDTENNTTGSNYVLHKAWISYSKNDQHTFILGKSQLPFGWKTGNFWPGDMFLAAYGDQMDVGLKYVGRYDSINVAAAFYPRDDWRKDSTDSTDDNRHWGSRKTYHKLDTWVGDITWTLQSSEKIGVSVQKGKLQESITGRDEKDGEHHAYTLYYDYTFDEFTFKVSYIKGVRHLPDAYFSLTGLPESIRNQRYNNELSYQYDKWTFLIDVTLAKSNTVGGLDKMAIAYAPGVRYNYGGGWIYLEYLNQNAWFDRDMKINDGNFAAWYLTLDYYW